MLLLHIWHQTRSSARPTPVVKEGGATLEGNGRFLAPAQQATEYHHHCCPRCPRRRRRRGDTLAAAAAVGGPRGLARAHTHEGSAPSIEFASEIGYSWHPAWSGGARTPIVLIACVLAQLESRLSRGHTEEDIPASSTFCPSIHRGHQFVLVRPLSGIFERRSGTRQPHSSAVLLFPSL